MMAPEPASPLLLLLFAAPWLALSASLPRAVIHVGPHKTATTYIQASGIHRKDMLTAAVLLLDGLLLETGEESQGNRRR